MPRLLLLVLSAVVCVASGFAQNVKNLTVYDAGIVEITEERTINLQTGFNQIEWRSLQPKADLRTVRVLAENADVIRQDVTFDGADVKNEKSPVLHLIIENKGAAGTRKITVDYLAPNVSWQNAYSLVLDSTLNSAPPTAAMLDSWVSVFNNTGTDLSADTVDLIAGEIALLGNDVARREYAIQAQSNASYDSAGANEAEYGTSASKISAFTRFRLGINIALTANKTVSRFPIFQRARLGVVQRNVFENEYNVQTVGRGGFNLLPRGLEVRLVGKNPTKDSMPAGSVTIYAKTTDGLQQVVGQDRIQLTPPEGEFTVTQGRSSTIFGARRIIERRTNNVKDENGNYDDRLTTKIEIVLTNRSPLPSEVYVRENIEAYDKNQWLILESSIPKENWEKLGTNAIQTKTIVPANGKTTVTYSIETR
jgi:hypothetical protein